MRRPIRRWRRNVFAGNGTHCVQYAGKILSVFMQGGAVWHPRCGPGPQPEDGRVLNGPENGNITDTDVSTKEFDRHSTSGASELQVSTCIAVFSD